MKPAWKHACDGKWLLAPLKSGTPHLELIWADSGYQKEGFCEWVKAELGWEIDIVEHPWSGRRSVRVPEGVEVNWEKIRPSGFHVLPCRWVVERTFGCLST
jgi:putative transposase